MTAKATLIFLYLLAIVAANLSIAHWGAQASIYNAFLFVGFGLATRDRLNDMWKDHLARNMAALIFAGSALSWVAGELWGSTFPGGPSIGRIALASAAAFALAATVDALVYWRYRNKPWLERSNRSNTVGAVVDSMVFLPLAGFGFLWTVMFSQACAKIAGGLITSLILNRTPGQEWTARNRTMWSR